MTKTIATKTIATPPRVAHAKPPGPKKYLFCIYLLVMPKYWGKQIFTHGRFHEVSQKQKTEREEKRRRRLNDGDNNGQATHGARKHAWRTQAAWANKMVYNLMHFSKITVEE